MLSEVVTMYGTLETMSNEELHLVMVQMCWQRKLRACENMQVQWRRKDVGQLHHFHQEASLVVPTVWLTCWIVVSPGSPWDTPPLLCIGSFTFMSCVLLSCLHHAFFFFSCLHFCACDAVTSQ